MDGITVRPSIFFFLCVFVYLRSNGTGRFFECYLQRFCCERDMLFHNSPITLPRVEKDSR